MIEMGLAIVFIAAIIGFGLYELIRRSRTTKRETAAIESDERVQYNTIRFHAMTLFISQFILFIGLAVLNYGLGKTHISISYVLIYIILTFAFLIAGTTFLKKR
jgi:drug/metabolite transporter (DMT)-like permease